MPLDQHVIDRENEQTLIQLTNAGGDRSATTINTAKLATAVKDTEATLEIIAGVPYDDTDPRHVATAVIGVIAFLRRYKGEPPDDARMTQFREDAERLRKVTGGDRATPETTSRFEPTDAPDGRPAFDNSHFADLIPGAPRPRDPSEY